MDQDSKELIQEVGKVVEDAGRMLKRKPSLSLQDLTDIRKTLTKCAKTIEIVQATEANRY
jgi:hypothetical protein